MSSILDALEKAAKKREAEAGASGASVGEESLRERRLREEAERARKRARNTLIVAGGLVLLGGGAIAVLALRNGGKGPAGDRTPSAVQAGAAETPAPAPTPTPIVIVVTPTATEAPPPTAYPSPTPWPSPTPPPTTSPVPTVRLTPTPSNLAALKDGQSIRPEDLGWQVSGTLEMGTGRYAIINGEHVRAGTRFGQFHIIDIQPGLINVDLGDGRIVNVVF